MPSCVINVRKLSAQDITAHEKMRITQILLAAFRGDLQVVAMTGGRADLEPALVQYQVEQCLSQGEVYVAGQDSSIDGVLFVYGPGQDDHDSPASPSAPSRAYVSKLAPEMQQWWINHFVPKYSELTNAALGSQEGRKAAWYIRVVAVHPDRQRRGIGRQLLEMVVKKADADEKKVCLEVNNDSLVRIFSNFRFRVRATKNFGSYQGGFILFLMVREASR